MGSAVHADLSLDTVLVSQDTLTARQLCSSSKFPMTLEEVEAGGYRILEWDGRHVVFVSAPSFPLTMIIGHRFQLPTRKELSMHILPVALFLINLPMSRGEPTRRWRVQPQSSMTPKRQRKTGGALSLLKSLGCHREMGMLYVPHQRLPFNSTP